MAGFNLRSLFQDINAPSEEEAAALREQEVQGIFGDPSQQVDVNVPDPTAMLSEPGTPIRQGASPFGLMNIEQQWQPQSQTGLFTDLPESQVPMMQSIKNMALSSDPDIREQAYKMLGDFGGDGNPTAADYLSARVSAYGAPENMVDGKDVNVGKMQRGIPNAGGGIDWLGRPYDPRNQFANTGTELTNVVRPDETIPINLKSAEREKQEGKSEVLSRFKQIDELKASEGSRIAGFKKAKYFYDKIDKGGMSSGGMRNLLSYLPFTFTEQGRMDEEFNAFSETAARQALKASGEIRPTDADVTGMKKALFGLGRDEQVNLRLLQDFMDSIKRDDHRAYLASQAKKYKESKKAAGTPPVNTQGWELMTDANGNSAYVGPNGEIEEIE